jgi:hypothetical protein
MSATSKIDTLFSGISITGSYPPHNGLAVGPTYIVSAEATRIQWTDLTGGGANQQSVFQFFKPLGATATNSLYDPRIIYDSVSGRFIVIMENIASNGAVSNIDIAVSKDSNPNDGWYFASLNTSLTINGQLTSSDRPSISIDGSNIYITAPQYNVNISGYAGTATWVIGKTAGSGGGLYGGGALTVVANEVTPSNQGIFTVAAGNNGKTYYASDYVTGSQVVVALQTYDTASATFGPITTIVLGNIDQGGSYTAQQQGTTLLLDAGDKHIQNLVYSNGFLYGVAEEKPIGSTVPLVHWFKIDVSNPNAPMLAAQGDISGASLGTNVATFNASLAVDGAGDVIINFTASGPNMYPSDYYVYQAASDPPGSFSAPILYQASTGFFNSGSGSGVQRWGAYSTAIPDPNNPHRFWISNEYVANNWWQTSVAQIEIDSTASIAVTSIVPTGTGISNGTGNLNAGSVITLTVNFSGAVTVNTGSGAPSLVLNDGGTAAYTGGSNTSALTFSYTVAPGQNTADLAISALALNGGTITDGAGNNADLSAVTNYNPAGTLQIDTTTNGTTRIQKLFAGISDPTDDPPDNGLAVGPNNLVMSEGQRVGWADLTGSGLTTLSAYSFFKPPGGATSWSGSLKDTFSTYDRVNGRYVYSTENLNPHTTPSSSYIALAVSKDSNPNDGWNFGTINSSTVINGVATTSDEPSLSVDGTNIYISAPQYNASGSGYQGSEFWVISDTTGAGGGIYNGGTPTVIANQLASASLGIFRDVAGYNGKSYFASAYNSGGQSRIALQIYDVATNTFGSMNSISLGNIDQSNGTSTFSAQQQGSSVVLNVDDGRIGNLVYVNGFLYGTNEIRPIGSSVPNVHWFKIDVSNPLNPALVAQGNISGAAIGTGVATFNGSIAVDGAGDLIINFNASGPNMYPSDYYVVDKANDPSYSFGAPVLYQASVQPFALDTNRWGANSSAVADPNNPNAFWISSEYIANNWWQTAVAQIVVQSASNPTIASITTSGAGITNGNGNLNAGKIVTLAVNFSSAVTVNTTNGSPTLALNDGGSASYVSGSGSNALVFSYVVAAGQNTADLAITSFALNGATVQDGLGNNANLSGAANFNPAGTLQIDTIAPTIPTALSLDATTDSGTKSDGITNFSQVKIDGAAEPGSTATLYDTNGTTVLGSGIANAATGTFSIATSSLSSGAHSITAKATDAAGNIGAASTAYPVAIDTSAPAAPTSLSLDASTDSGTLGDGVTNFTQVKLDGTAEAGSTVTIYDSNGTTMLGSGTANAATGAFSITTSTLTAGTHSITATTTDAAGNISTPSSAYAVTVNGVAPAAPTGLSLDASTDSGTAGDGITNFTRMKIDGIAGPGNTVTLYDTNGTTVLGSGTADTTTGTFGIITSELFSGAHSITAKATDAVGNTSAASAIYLVNVDTAAPAAPTGLTLDASTDSGTTGDGITNFTQVKIDGTAEGGSTVTLYDSNGTTALGSGTANAVTGAFSITTSPLTAGTHSITAAATDAAGNISTPSSPYAVTINVGTPASTSEVETLFSGPSNTTSYPPHNGLAAGPNNVIMLDGARIEWSNLTGGAATTQSVYSFFGSLGAAATNSLYHPRAVYDAVNGRYIVTMDNIGSAGTVSNADIAVSKDSNPNDGWYFASLNTSLTINGQLTSSDHPMLSVDGSNIYIAASQYNVNVPGYAGTALWVIGDTAGAGGGIYNGGTMSVVANQITPSSQGIFAEVASNNGKTYYASDYLNGSQIVVTLQTYDAATNAFGTASTIALGNIDQGGAYTAQQLGTNLLLDAGDKHIQNLQYLNGFLYGVAEVKPIGSNVPLVHWFKIDVSNPSSPTLVAQGDISGASLGTNVATLNGSIAADPAGDVLINFTASGPNMYPSDYYVYQAASSSSGGFSAPILYQPSTGFFDSGNGSSTQRWGTYSTAIPDPNNPGSFWISNEYIANGWWQTSVAQVQIQSTPEVPLLTLGSNALTVNAGGSVALPINVASFDADDTVSVTISGLASYETVTDNLDQTTFSGNAITLSAAEINSGLALHSSYGGSDHPVNTLTITASNTTAGEVATSAPQAIVVTDPPIASANTAIAPPAPVANAGSSLPSMEKLALLMDQYMATGFHGLAGNDIRQGYLALPTLAEPGGPLPPLSPSQPLYAPPLH